jgi:hypothetical protein
VTKARISRSIAGIAGNTCSVGPLGTGTVEADVITATPFGHVLRLARQRSPRQRDGVERHDRWSIDGTWGRLLTEMYVVDRDVR